MDSTINHRIKQLRKHCKLNQDDFGKRIGLKHGAISKMEKPGNTVIDQNIRLICDTFNVSEDWLRTGEGDMFESNDEVLLKQLATEYKLEGGTLELIRNFLMLTAEQRAAILHAATIVAEANKKAMAAAQAADAPPVSNSDAIVEEPTPENLTEEEKEILRQLRMEKSTRTTTASRYISSG